MNVVEKLIAIISKVGGYHQMKNTGKGSVYLPVFWFTNKFRSIWLHWWGTRPVDTLSMMRELSIRF